jgi:hypothetical protein
MGLPQMIAATHEARRQYCIGVAAGLLTALIAGLINGMVL